MDPIIDRAIKATRALAYRMPEFLIAFMYVKHLLRAAPVGTVCVEENGRITLDPKFCEPLSQDQLAGVIAHELLHLQLMHFGRRMGRDAKLWNVAGDWCINAALKAGGVPLPEGCLYPDPKYTGELTTENVYEWLQQNGGAGSGSFGQGCGVMPSEGGAAAPADAELPIDWAQVARDTVNAAKAAGRGSSPIVRCLEPRAPRQSWDRILRHGTAGAVNGASRDVATYRRLARRSAVGFIRPGYVSTTVRVAVIIDVSGSMHGDWAEQIFAECLKITEVTKGLSIFVVAHTSEVVWQGWVKAGEKAKLKEAFAQSGGTDPQPAYTATAAQGKRFDAVIHFTDCEFFQRSWPEVPAKRLVVGAFGSGATGHGCKPPAGATVIPCDPNVRG